MLLREACRELSGHARSAARARPRWARTRLASGLLPGQTFLAPAADGAAMMFLVERPLEAFEHVVDLAEARLLERLAGADGALAAATDHHDRPIHARDLAHLSH